MRSSARSTDGRRAFTLLEILIAITIFSIVLLLALSGLTESGDAARLSTIQADLRKSAEKVMGDIVKDLRSTQVVYSGASNCYGGQNQIGTTLEFVKITGFDPNTGVPILNGNTAAPFNAIGVTTIVSRYTLCGTNTTGTTSAGPIGANPSNGYIDFQEGLISALQASNPPTVRHIALETALSNDADWPYGAQVGAYTVSGFEVATVPATSLPGLITNSGSPITFGAAGASAPPVVLRIRLVFKRILGVNGNNTKQYVWSTAETEVQLRPDQSY